MKKGILLTCLLLFILKSVSAQVYDISMSLKERKNNSPVDSTKNWNVGGLLDLSFSQAGFTNWSAGGEPSVSINSTINLHALYKNGKNSWDNFFDFGYGFIHQKDGKTIKTNDNIDLVTQWGHLAKKNLYYTAMFDFKTQLSAGYEYPNDSDAISDFIAPGYLIGGLGMEYRPSETVFVFLAPASDKTTIVNSDLLSNIGAFGVEPGQKIRTEFGCFTKIIVEKELFNNNLSFRSRMDLFSDYCQHPLNIDVDMELGLVYKLSKYFSFSANAELIYDDDVKTEIYNEEGIAEMHGPHVQFKELIGLGINYKF